MHAGITTNTRLGLQCKYINQQETCMMTNKCSYMLITYIHPNCMLIPMNTTDLHPQNEVHIPFIPLDVVGTCRFHSYQVKG